MPSLLHKLLLTGVVLLMAMPAYGEYYQYRDAGGVLRFTDDIASVPPEQRPDVKTHESVKSTPVQPKSHAAPAKKNARASTPLPDSMSTQAGSWNERISRQADELDRMQVELKKDYHALQSERVALEEKAPPAWATAESQDAYRRQVEALNARIARYGAQYAEYQEKEKAFTSRYKK